MKKKIPVLLVAIVLALGLSACGSCSPTEVTDRLDVQSVWKEVTGMDGYPQACLIAKSDLLQSSGGFVNDFVTALKAGDGWAEQNPSKAVAAVHAHMIDGSASTTPNVTADVVKRCHIKTVSATDDKNSLQAYFNCFIDTEPKLIGGKLPDDGFYCTPQAGGTSPAGAKVFMPDGATALALSPMMENNAQVAGTSVSYTVVPSNDIRNYVVSGEADLAVVPSNLAANLYNQNGKYKLVATLTHGNLYIVGGDMDGVESLVGSVVGVIGRGNVPDIVFRYILKCKNIECDTESVSAVDNKVVIAYYNDGAAVIRALTAGQIDFGFLAEPAASTVYDKIHEEK